MERKVPGAQFVVAADQPVPKRRRLEESDESRSSRKKAPIRFSLS
jgi:hypothetical protein